jgi:hypothetical protein
MSASPETSDVLHEFKEFVEFLQHLWAILAGVSVLFPLSNTFVGIIPLAQWSDGGLTYLSPALVSGCATLGCLFTVLWTFGQREAMRAPRAWNSLPRQAVRSLALGSVGLLVYLAGHYAIRDDFYFRVLGWESNDLRRITGDLVLVIGYGGFFVFVTRAFLALGLREYLRAPGAPGPTSAASPSARRPPPPRRSQTRRR